MEFRSAGMGLGWVQAAVAVVLAWAGCSWGNQGLDGTSY
jgi:hypothetical protein